MGNWFVALITSTVFQTVISGTIVFILGQVALLMVLEPIKEFKKIIAKIDNKLKYYAFVTSNSGTKEEFVREARETFRDLSCELESTYKQIPWPSFWCLPYKQQIAQAAQELIGLSNTANNPGKEDKNTEISIKIRENLKIEEL